MPGCDVRAERGRRSYLNGYAAEASVARHYARRGMNLLAHRWRGKGGEIDLIFREDDTLVFVEVKTSRTFEDAALHLRPAQCRRLFTAATEFAAAQPRGLLSEMRFDVALVDGTGQVRVLENALLEGCF